MREFPTKNGKINFVDEDDTLVGFDNQASCCENFGWFYSKEVPVKLPEEKITPDLEPYFFNKGFFAECSDPAILDDGKIVTFRLEIKNDDQYLYLSLYNAHNGYYSHGFNLAVGGKDLRTGSI